jgi:hypothetical protein
MRNDTAPMAGEETRPEIPIPTLRCVTIIREPDGYRMVVAEVPADVVRRHMVQNREPNLREIAEAHALRALGEAFR